MPRALIVGGTGLIGIASARRLLAAGWEVDLTGRHAAHVPADVSAAGARFMVADRHDPTALAGALGDGTDLLVDCICYTAADASALVPLLADAGATVMISTNAVYIDSAGRHTNSLVSPVFDGPISEDQPTVAAGHGDYMTRDGYGENKVAAEQVLLDSGAPLSVLRPGKIHGPGARRPREWVFVKRVLDRRPAVVLRRGAAVAQPTAAANIAALIETVAARPGQRILNSGDPDAPSALEIARVIASHLDYRWEEILIEDGVNGPLGRHPWDTSAPIMLDMAAAIHLGYTPVGSYAVTVVEEVDWLVAVALGGPGARLPAGLDEAYFEDMFDYDTEDRYLSARNV